MGILTWWRSLGHNVKFNFLFAASNGAAQSIIAGSSTMAAYIYFLEGSNNSADDVGFVSATLGLCMLVLSLPVGYLTDKWRRDKMLKISGILGLLTSAVLAVALTFDSMLALYFYAGVNGCFMAVNGPALSSIFADSIPTGGRTAIYTTNYAVTLAAGGLGPFIALLIMVAMGNQWRTPQLRAVMWTGNVLNALSCCILPFFNDDLALGSKSEGILAEGTTTDTLEQPLLLPANTGQGGDGGDGTVEGKGDGGTNGPLKSGNSGVDSAIPVTGDASSDVVQDTQAQLDTQGASAESRAQEGNGTATKGSPEAPVNDSGTMNLGHQTVRLLPRSLANGLCCACRLLAARARRRRKEGQQQQQQQQPEHQDSQGSTAAKGEEADEAEDWGLLRVRHLPWVIFLSDFSIAVGAGMTVQYFALFFANGYDLPPVEVSAIYTASPLLIAALSSAAGAASKVFGRAWMAVLCDAVGTACLFGLWAKLPIAAAVPLYLLRTSAMNASYPIQRAILMDMVPKNKRGMWNSLEGLTAFTWTGSAALGGILIDKFGYGYTFFITGAIYSVATCILLLLVPLTAGEKPDAKGKSASAH